MSGKVLREREPISALPSEAEISHRKENGWRLVAVEWERESSSAATEEEPPFGLHISPSKTGLEVDPSEWDALVLMMELTVQEGPYWSIAEELNRRGYRTRSGGRWTPISVFQMLPRLIELGPRILSSDTWLKRKSRPQGD